MIPTLVINVIYTYLNNFYGRIDTFLVIFTLNTLSSLSIQAISHLFVIVFNKSAKTAVMVTLYVYVAQYVFSNWMVYTKELHYSLRVLTNLFQVKLSFEALVVYIYGFNRCDEREFSGVLYMLDIDDNTFYTNICLLIIYVILFRGLAIIAFIIKSNGISNNQKSSEELTNLRNCNKTTRSLF